jgi:hypothetical protein
MFGLATQRTFANVGKRHHRLSANWHFGTFDFWHTARLSPTAFFEKAKKHPGCVTNLARKFLRHNRTSTATACEATASPKRQQGVALMMQHTSAVGQP